MAGQFKTISINKNRRRINKNLKGIKMETLVEMMKKVLADTFAMYLKSHNYHWNVEGPNFPQYHDFFGNLYQELHGAVDTIAEQIRALDSYAPGSFSRFMELTEIEDELNVPLGTDMARKLSTDNEKVLNTLNVTFKLAEQFDQQGLMDFLAGRIDTHKKHAWMLRSISK
jgi:starvation-inducible DNA-binding protein